jgi:hypothetical protein
MENLEIKKYEVIIEHSDWYSKNERTFKIDLDSHNDFKHLTNAMKKHTRLAKKEMIGDCVINLLAETRNWTNNGLLLFDLKRYIIFDGCKVNEMDFVQELDSYETKQIINCETNHKATNYVFDEIRITLENRKKSLA